MSTDAQVPDRAVRQRDLVPPARLAACHALVIGVGAIGRQVALQLAAVGVPRLTLCDDDTVSTENLAPQGYGPGDVQAQKVVAARSACLQMHPALSIEVIPERFRRSLAARLPLEDKLIAFACVDDIGTRRMLWESLKSRAALFIDGRMSAEVLRVLAVNRPLADTYYPTTLFTSEEAYAGACTARSTIYTASIAAGLMVGQFTRWLRDLPVDRDVVLNLLAMEMTVNSGTST